MKRYRLIGGYLLVYAWASLLAGALLLRSDATGQDRHDIFGTWIWIAAFIFHRALLAASAVCLLMRKNWARWSTIALLLSSFVGRELVIWASVFPILGVVMIGGMIHFVLSLASILLLAIPPRCSTEW